MQAEAEIIRQQFRSLIDPDQSSLRPVALVLFSAFWIYTALLTLPFAYWMPGTSIDGSHQFGSNYFPNAGFKYGSDLIFPFGPLGYLIYPENIGNHIVVANLIRAAIWLILLVHLILFYRLGMPGFWKSLLLMLAIIPARLLFLGSFDYYAVAVLLVLILFLIERPNRWQAFLASVSIIFITCILAMTRFNGYVYALAGIGLLFAVSTSSPRKGLLRRDLYLGLAAVVMPTLTFLLHNHSLRGLFNYVYGSLQLSSGYNEAMSLPTTTADFFYIVLLSTLFVLGVIYAGAKRALAWRVAFVLLFMYWLSFKHGFVRADDHPPMTFCFEIIVAALVVCLLHPGSGLFPQYIAAYPFFAIVAMSGINLHWPIVWTDAFWSSASTRQTAAEMIDWNATVKRIEAEKEKTDEFQRLPQTFRSTLENSTAIVFPWEAAYARSSRFKLQPLYAMQAYCAYTEYLDRKTAEHLRANRERTDYVLFEWEALDGRHPLLDVPSTWMALTDNYEPAKVSGNKLLLKRRATPLTHKQRPVQGLALPIGKWIDLPERKSDLWATIRIPYSTVGLLRKTLYKANAIYLTVESNGVAGRFRVVPGVLSSPFPLTSFPTYFESLVDVLKSNRVEAPITRLRLDAESPGDYGEPSLQLLQETDSQLTFADFSENSFQSKFHMNSPSAIDNVMSCCVDGINGLHPTPFPDQQHPFRIDNDGALLEGWFADRSDGRAFDEVYAVVNERKLFRATVVLRPDVTASLKNPALDRSGFRILIGPKDFEGIQKLDLIGVMGPNRALYRFANPLYVEFR